MEVIGLALGVAPLMIQILKSNPQPVDALKSASSENACELLSEFYCNLQYEVSMLQFTLTNLVNGLAISPELKDKLTNGKSLDSAVWKHPPEALQYALRERLQAFAEPFKQSMEKILRLLAKLVDDKSLRSVVAAEQVLVCTDTPYAKLEVFLDGHFTPSTRLRLGWKKKNRDIIMTGITKYNKKLQKMEERSAKSRAPQSLVESRSTSDFVPHLGVRQTMSELRFRLERARCTCEDEHEMRFGLSRMMNGVDGIRLDMIMNMSTNDGKCHWAESKINIHLQDAPAPGMMNVRRHRRASSSFSGTTLTGSPKDYVGSESPHKTSRKAPTIEASKDHTQCSSCTKEFGSLHHRFTVDDICVISKQAQRARRAPRLVFCQDGLWHNGTTTDTVVARSEPGRRLEAYLQRGIMSMRDRKILQVLLAQSVLFFPWNGQDLNKSSIAFHCDFARPFATLVLDQYNDLTQPVPGLEPETLEFRPYNNELLAALATTLLEIELEKRIEDLQSDEDAGDEESSPFITNFWTLTRVLKDQESNMYRGCYEAIDACIRCDFSDGPSRFDNPKFLQRVYDHIVAPLERELWHGFSYRVPYPEDPGQGDIAASLDMERWAVSSPPRHGKSVKIAEDLLSRVPEDGVTTVEARRT